MAKHIYFVGRPYPQLESLSLMQNPGYKIGLLKDIKLNLRKSQLFDTIVEVDFSSPQAMFASLHGKNLVIDGLVCTYENYIVAKSQLAKHFGVVAQSVESAQMNTDKYLMRQAFERTDPSITPGFGLADTEATALELAEQLNYPLILKPTNLVKSLLVLICNNEIELRRNLAYAQARISKLYQRYNVYGRQPRLILEQYVKGNSCSIAAFVDKVGQPHFCQGIVSITNAQEIGVDDNYLYRRLLPASLDKQLKTQLFETARKGVAALAMTSSPAHIELIYNDQEIKLIEIGARIGGYRPRMYGKSYGLDLIDQEIQLALGKTPDLSGDFRAYTAVYELFPKAEGKFVGIDGLVDNLSFESYKVKVKVGDPIGPAKNGYKAAAVIVVSHHDQQKFLEICQSVDKLAVRIK